MRFKMILCSIICGLLSSYVIYKLCYKSVIYQGPDSNIIRKETYIDDNKQCYVFEPIIRICPISIKNI